MGTGKRPDDSDRMLLATSDEVAACVRRSDDGTVVGMLNDAKGRHFAFRWRNGVLQRLNDLPHPPGWRFESAYTIGEGGSIAGIGTLDGVAKIFIWRLRSSSGPSDSRYGQR